MIDENRITVSVIVNPEVTFGLSADHLDNVSDYTENWDEFDRMFAKIQCDIKKHLRDVRVRAKLRKSEQFLCDEYSNLRVGKHFGYDMPVAELASVEEYLASLTFDESEDQDSSSTPPKESFLTDEKEYWQSLSDKFSVDIYMTYNCESATLPIYAMGNFKFTKGAKPKMFLPMAIRDTEDCTLELDAV